MEANIEAPLAGEMGPYLYGKPEYDRKRKALLAEYSVPEIQADWEKNTLRAAANPGVEHEWTLTWDVLGVVFDNGQEILKLDPSQRTQKQQDQLTDHVIQWYDDVVSEERYKELKFKELREKLEKLAEEYPALSEAQTLAQNPKPPKTHLLIRGDFRQPGIEVHPNTPAVLPPLLPHDGLPTRLALAPVVGFPGQPADSARNGQPGCGRNSLAGVW